MKILSQPLFVYTNCVLQGIDYLDIVNCSTKCAKANVGWFGCVKHLRYLYNRKDCTIQRPILTIL